MAATRVTPPANEPVSPSTPPGSANGWACVFFPGPSERVLRPFLVAYSQSYVSPQDSEESPFATERSFPGLILRSLRRSVFTRR